MRPLRPTSFEFSIPAMRGHTLRGLRYMDVTAPSDGSSRWLLLHGWLDNAASFERLVPQLFSTHLANDVTAVDMSGHGKSDHRSGPYHSTDYVAEVALLADHLYGPGVPFSLCGHSLGGGIALAAAGVLAPRISRLVLLESVGLLSGDASSAPRQLAKSMSKLPSGQTSVFASLEAAAARRAQKNVVPDPLFTIDSARVLASRGLRPVDGGVTWSTDPWLLLPTRMYMPEDVQRALASRVTAPTLIILTRDGIFQNLMRIPLLRRFGLDTLAMLLVARSLKHAARCCTILTAWWLSVNAQSKRFQRSCAILAEISHRLRSIRDCDVRVIARGGHHPHLTEASAVVAEITPWMKKVAKRSPVEADPESRRSMM
ncbi:hypothetical protein AB1Y20_016845 [Prymnesium parvum]|uniref:AB hydrolase-1 domain-containing protein n=1 Tax=Prymnesium parvum TaxID=97485 RepID=A0AB34ICA8_PRYPA